MMTLISVIALLTAIVVMATKIVELLSALHKKKEVRQQPETQIEQSTSSSARAWPVWFRILCIIVCLFSMIYLMLVPSPHPLEREDVAWIGLLVATYVVASLSK